MKWDWLNFRKSEKSDYPADTEERDDHIDELEPNHPIFQPFREESFRYPRPTVPPQPSGHGYRSSPGRTYGSRYDTLPRRRYDANRYDTEQEVQNNSRILWQVIGAGLLVVMVLVITRSNLPLAQKANEWVRTAFTEEFDVSGVPTWYQTHFGQKFPLPSMPVSQTEIESVQFPVGDGTIVTDYQAQTHPAVVLQASPGSIVNAAMKGTVEVVDQNELYGQFIIIDQGKSGKTLYGRLSDVTVKSSDVVTAGQPIAKTALGTKGLYFGYLQDNVFVNPHKILDSIKR